VFVPIDGKIRSVVKTTHFCDKVNVVFLYVFYPLNAYYLQGFRFRERCIITKDHGSVDSITHFLGVLHFEPPWWSRCGHPPSFARATLW
jgi:hypothetical protein